MATNNVEGLQDAIIGSAKSLATYNQEQGRFEITGANIRRAKEMSNATGISYKELTNTAIAAQERLSATADLMANGLTFKNEGDKEFLTNLAHMKDGKMVIDIPSGLQKQFEGVKDGQLSLENMSQKQIDALLEQRREFEKKSDTEIIQSQLTVLSNISTNASYILEILKNRVGRTGQKAIETKLGLNTQDVNATMAKYSSMAANTIKDTDRKANEYFFGKENDINKPKPKGVAKQDYKPVDVQQKPANNNQTTQESKQTNENVTIQMEIKANDSHVDKIKRTLIQSVTAEDIRSYLHSHKKK
jgi:hypothetical protein